MKSSELLSKGIVLRGAGAISPAPRQQTMPLSFAQERLWFLDQLEPGGAVYSMPGTFRLKGPLNVPALEWSLNEVVRRHEALRTTFSNFAGLPQQVVASGLIVPLPLTDLSDRSEIDRENEARCVVAEEARRPFDLCRGPLVRATLLRLHQEEHFLLLNIHHIVSDGWSMGVFFGELSVLYESYSNGKASPLPELPIQYADYAVWQRNWLRGEVLQTQLSYWKKQLENISILQLPTDRPRPAAQSFHGANLSLELSKELTKGLRVLSRKQGVSLFMTLLAAFQILLHRYTGQDDIAVGSPIAGRNRAEIEGLIGFFINTLVLRMHLSGDLTFRELLARVREMALGAYDHQGLPFEKLVEALHPERDLSRAPLFQVMFHLSNVPKTIPELQGVKVEKLQFDSEITKFDLTLSMIEDGENLKGSLEYSTDLFDGATIDRMSGHFKKLLEGILANPERRISDLPLLIDAERQQLLVGWNHTKRESTRTECVPQLFEAQVERTPQAIAVAFGAEQLNYEELNRRANRLAHHLKSRGVGPEVVVGVCMERSLEMIVGVLAILKAGGVYLPLAPDYPKERLGFMLTDSQAALLLTQKQWMEKLFEDGASYVEDGDSRSSILNPQLKVVCLDETWETAGQRNGENLRCETTCENLAYIIYTSGSTGKPKGVLISHGAIARHCLDIQKHYELNSSDRVLQFASMHFDVSLEQILPTLIAGAGLILKESEMWTATDFLKKISEMGLTIVNLPTAYWCQLAQAWSKLTEPVPNNRLKLVTAGGETMPPESLRLWRKTPLHSVRFLNCYGPTEATITATTFDAPSRLSQDTLLERIPIGRPIGRRRLYILDENDNPTPIGIPGELHIGGTALARGYLNRPDLTAENFIPDPFHESPGSRLYRTGDRARYLPDGNIEFLGRLDNQVKIRGFRIELGEIETVLRQHPAVSAAAVMAREDHRNGDWRLPNAEGEDSKSPDQRLVAYVVAQEQPVPDPSELRSFLKAKVPASMVPAVFVMLENLPLTPTGKVDRRALPAQDRATPGPKDIHAVPGTDDEKLLAQIWAEVLGLECVGVHSNFFDLGGHSLLATQLISRVNAKFHTQMTVRTLFEWPTIAEFALVIMRSRPGAEEDLAHILSELEHLSDQDAERLLAAVKS